MTHLSLALLLVIAMRAVGVDTPPALTVQLDGRGPVIFTPTDFARLPRQMVRVRDHHGTELSFEGVLLRELLAQSGAPVGESLGKVVADNALMLGGLKIWDQAGVGLALQEHFVQVYKPR
jgi:hypothetical protein